MDWLNAGALSLMLMMLVGTFHLGAILTGEVGTVARHAVNLVNVQPLIRVVELPNYNGSGSGGSKATLNNGGDFEVAANQPASENHCEQLGGNYSEDNCCSGPNGMYFCKGRVFAETDT